MLTVLLPLVLPLPLLQTHFCGPWREQDSRSSRNIWYVAFPFSRLLSHITELTISIQFHGLGVNWAGTLLGCVASLLVPIPVMFYFYGPKLRARSKFAPTFFPAVQATEDERDHQE